MQKRYVRFKNFYYFKDESDKLNTEIHLKYGAILYQGIIPNKKYTQIMPDVFEILISSYIKIIDEIIVDIKSFEKFNIKYSSKFLKRLADIKFMYLCKKAHSLK